MNIFFLDKMPAMAAQYASDSHVRKIILETIEMMGYPFPKGKFEPWPWVHTKGRHLNHPMSKWVRESRQNYDWTFQYCESLCEEFNYRFNKAHKCKTYLDWIARNLPIDNLPNLGQTEPPRCFSTFKEQIDVSNDVVFDYRRYYMIAKKHLAVWTKRETPFWYQ